MWHTSPTLAGAYNHPKASPAPFTGAQSMGSGGGGEACPGVQSGLLRRHFWADLARSEAYTGTTYKPLGIAIPCVVSGRQECWQELK